MKKCVIVSADEQMRARVQRLETALVYTFVLLPC